MTFSWISRLPFNFLAARKNSMRMGQILFAGGWLIMATCLCARLVSAQAHGQTHWQTIGQTVDWMVALALAFAMIVSGAAVMIIDAVKTGFGVLDHFFQAALDRSAKRKTADENADTPSQGPQSSSRVRDRGMIGDRPYVVYDDGAVAVETLLGMRLFNSLVEAQEFIGG